LGSSHLVVGLSLNLLCAQAFSSLSL